MASFRFDKCGKYGWVIASLVASLSGCKLGNGPAASTTTLSATAFAQRYQTHGCLDVEALMNAMVNAPVSRSTITDIHIVDDKTPVSGSFRQSITTLVLNTSNPEVPAQNSIFLVHQTGCDRVLIPLKTQRGSLMSAFLQQPQVTQITTQPMTDNSSMISGAYGFFQMSWQVIDTNRVKVVYSIAQTITHSPTDCSAHPSESHEVAITQILDMNSPYVANDGPSDAMRKILAPIASNDEKNYCGGVQNQL